MSPKLSTYTQCWIESGLATSTTSGPVPLLNRALPPISLASEHLYSEDPLCKIKRPRKPHRQVTTTNEGLVAITKHLPIQHLRIHPKFPGSISERQAEELAQPNRHPHPVKSVLNVRDPHVNKNVLEGTRPSGIALQFETGKAFGSSKRCNRWPAKQLTVRTAI